MRFLFALLLCGLANTASGTTFPDSVFAGYGFQTGINPSVTPQFDSSNSATFTVSNGANAPISPSGSTHYYLVTICENMTTGAMGVYICGNGTCTQVSAAAIFVASTTSPAAGKFSVQYSGSTYNVYNNQGNTGRFSVNLIRLY